MGAEGGLAGTFALVTSGKAPNGRRVMERTLLLIKPDAIARGMIGGIISRIERKGLRIIGLKMIRMSQEVAEKLYAAHVGKPFYEPLLRFMRASAIVALVVEGKDAVDVLRKLMGATNCREAKPGTMRGDLGMSYRFNLVHGSGSRQEAAKELALFFSEEELFPSDKSQLAWIYDWQTGEPI